MPSNRKKARRALRDFIQRTGGELPHAAREDQYVRTPAGRLFLQDIRTVLRSERAARAQAKAQRDAAAVQSGKAAEAAAVVARLQEQNTTLRKSLANAGQDEVLYPNTVRALQGTVRKLREENDTLRTQAETIEQLNAAKVAAEKQNRILQSSYDHAAAAHKKAEQTVRDMADQLRNLPTPEMWNKTQDRVRELSMELSRAYTHTGRDDFNETARAEAVRLQREVDRQAGLLQGAHKDAGTLTADRDAARSELARANEALVNLRRTMRAGGSASDEIVGLLTKLGDRFYGKGWAE